MSKLFRLCEKLANDYSGFPKKAEEMYSILIVLFRYPLIRENRKISVNKQYFFEEVAMKTLHEKCKDLFSEDQNRSIYAILNRIKKINEKTDLIDLKRENIEEQKNMARHLLTDWCFVVFMLNKIAASKEKFIPLNNDPQDFNKVIQKRFSVSLDENQLFDKRLSLYGIRALEISATGEGLGEIKDAADPIVKAPTECTPSELDAFQTLVVEGGEVSQHGLRQRIEQSEALIFINKSKCIAVGAIKNPNQNYKARVFSKAGVADKSPNYIYELGWLYVTPQARGEGLGHDLMRAITNYLGDSTCYATTRENNEAMHYLLPQYGFQRLGLAYPSDNGYSLVLYGKAPKF